MLHICCRLRRLLVLQLPHDSSWFSILPPENEGFWDEARPHRWPRPKIPCAHPKTLSCFHLLNLLLFP